MQLNIIICMERSGSLSEDDTLESVYDKVECHPRETAHDLTIEF